MKILCVDSLNVSLSLTSGVWYDVIEIDESKHFGHYRIIDDRKNKTSWSKNRFKTIEEIREDKLNELGI
jgi:hypothetical protein